MIVDCSEEDPTNLTLMSGYEPQLVKDVLTLSNMTYGVDYIFQCTTFDGLYGGVYDANENSSVIGSFSGLPVTTMELSDGLEFSQPTIETGLSVLFHSKDTNTGLASWFFLRAFTWSAALSIVLVPLALSVLIWIFQNKEQPFLNYVYHLYSSYFKIDFFRNNKIEAMFVEVNFKVFALVVMILYVALTTNIIFKEKEFGKVDTINNMRGELVATEFNFENYVYNSHMKYVELPWTTSNQEFAQEIRKAPTEYVVYDTIFSDYYLQVDCDVHMALRNFVSLQYAMLWTWYTPQEFKDMYNENLIVALTQRSQAERLAEANEIFLRGSTKCSNNAIENRDKVNFSDVQGLWVIWLIVFSIAFLAAVLSNVIKHFARKSQSMFDLEMRGKREADLLKCHASNAASLVIIHQKIHQIRREMYLQGFDHFILQIDFSKFLADKLATLKDDDDVKLIIEGDSKVANKLKKGIKKNLMQRILGRGSLSFQKRSQSFRDQSSKLSIDMKPHHSVNNSHDDIDEHNSSVQSRNKAGDDVLKVMMDIGGPLSPKAFPSQKSFLSQKSVKFASLKSLIPELTEKIKAVVTPEDSKKQVRIKISPKVINQYSDYLKDKVAALDDEKSEFSSRLSSVLGIKSIGIGTLTTKHFFSAEADPLSPNESKGLLHRSSFFSVESPTYANKKQRSTIPAISYQKNPSVISSSEKTANSGNKMQSKTDTGNQNLSIDMGHVIVKKSQFSIADRSPLMPRSTTSMHLGVKASNTDNTQVPLKSSNAKMHRYSMSITNNIENKD